MPQTTWLQRLSCFAATSVASFQLPFKPSTEFFSAHAFAPIYKPLDKVDFVGIVCTPPVYLLAPP